MTFRETLRVSILAAFAIPMAFAQTQAINGGIRGRVVDPVGAPVGQATVKVENTQTGFNRGRGNGGRRLLCCPQSSARYLCGDRQKTGFETRAASGVDPRCRHGSDDRCSTEDRRGEHNGRGQRRRADGRSGARQHRPNDRLRRNEQSAADIAQSVQLHSFPAGHQRASESGAGYSAAAEHQRSGRTA